MEILELKLLQNRESIQNSIESLEKDCNYLQDQTKSLELSSLLNEAALILISEDKIQESLEFLRRAESLSSNSTKHKANSFNSIASFYRKQGKIITALKYIERSISVHPSGSAYLNLCAVLNIQGKFDKALEIAMHTIIFVQDEIIEEQADFNKRSYEKSEILSLAFYNLAVQLEYLKRTDEASSYYRKSVEFSSKYLPEHNPIREILSQIYEKIIAGHRKIIESKSKSELKPVQNQHIHHPQAKKRVVIKANRSKSPAVKSPLAVKEPIEKKLSRNPTSHRKFVKIGITKAKFMENYSNVRTEDSEETNRLTSRSMKLEKGQSEISLKNKIDEKKNSDREVNDKKKEKKVLKFNKVGGDRMQDERDKGGNEGKGMFETDLDGNGHGHGHGTVASIGAGSKGKMDSQASGIDEDSQEKVKGKGKGKEGGDKGLDGVARTSRDESFGVHFENEQDVKEIEFEVDNLSPVQKNYSIDIEKFMVVTGEGFNEMIDEDIEVKSDHNDTKSIKSESVKRESIQCSSRKSKSSDSDKPSSSSKSLKKQQSSIENKGNISEELHKTENSLQSNENSSEDEKKSEYLIENKEKSIKSSDKESQSFEINFKSNKKSLDEDQSIEIKKKSESIELSDKEKSNDSSHEFIAKDRKSLDKEQENNKEEFLNMNVLNQSDDDDENTSQKEKLLMTAERSLKFIVRTTKSNKDSLFDSFQLPKKFNSSQKCLSKLL
jgi:tetratricopeptide (TPR) repeat protein